MTAQPLSFSHAIIDADGPRNPHVKAAGDIDGDGRADVVVASSAGGPLVWYHSPEWARHVIAPSGRWSCDAKLVDMNGDGAPDLVISEWYTHDRMEWYQNPGPDGDPATDPWQQHIIGSPRAHDVQLGDIDGDGALEICTRQQGKQGSEIVVWKQTGTDEWTKRTVACPTGEGLALGDVDGDGRPEAVIGGRWYDPPDDILKDEWREHVFADWPPDAVVRIADMNRDGRADVILTRSEGHHRLSWFEAPPDPITGMWNEHVIDDSVDFAHTLAVCDLDGDGQLDVVTAEMHQSPRKRVMVYLNRSDASDWTRQIVATTGSHNLCVADTRGDGRPSLVGANWSGEYQPVELWEQTGL